MVLKSIYSGNILEAFFWRKSFNPIIVTNSKIILFETVPNKLVGFVGEGGVFRIIKLAGDGVLGGDSPS